MINKNRISSVLDLLQNKNKIQNIALPKVEHRYLRMQRLYQNAI